MATISWPFNIIGWGLVPSAYETDGHPIVGDERGIFDNSNILQFKTTVGPGKRRLLNESPHDRYSVSFVCTKKQLQAWRTWFKESARSGVHKVIAPDFEYNDTGQPAALRTWYFDEDAPPSFQGMGTQDRYLLTVNLKMTRNQT